MPGAQYCPCTAPNPPAGAFGCTISGAGPTAVAIVRDQDLGHRVKEAIMAAFKYGGAAGGMLGWQEGEGSQGECLDTSLLPPRRGGDWEDGGAAGGAVMAERGEHAAGNEVVMAGEGAGVGLRAAQRPVVVCREKCRMSEL